MLVHQSLSVNEYKLVLAAWLLTKSSMSDSSRCLGVLRDSNIQIHPCKDGAESQMPSLPPRAARARSTDDPGASRGDEARNSEERAVNGGWNCNLTRRTVTRSRVLKAWISQIGDVGYQLKVAQAPTCLMAAMNVSIVRSHSAVLCRPKSAGLLSVHSCESRVVACDTAPPPAQPLFTTSRSSNFILQDPSTKLAAVPADQKRRLKL